MIIPSCPPSCVREDQQLQELRRIIIAHLADLELRRFLYIGIRTECGREKLRELLEIHLGDVRI